MSGPETACFRSNIGPIGRRRRLLAGAGAIVLAAAGGTALVLLGVGPPVLRLLLLPVLFFGFLGLLQARSGL